MQFFTFLSEQLARISCGLLQVFVANGHEESSSLSWEHRVFFGKTLRQELIAN